MKQNPSLAEMQEMVAKGEIPHASSLDELLSYSATTFAMGVAYLTGMPLSRIHMKFVKQDLPGMPGKIMMEYHFTPELTPEEEPTVKRAMEFMARLGGSRPPIYPDKA